MQLQSLMFVLFMAIVFPIFVLSTNHDVFFVVFSLILFISSIRNIHKLFFKVEKPSSEEDDDDIFDDIEEVTNIDAKRAGVGTKVVKNLLISLFFLYCCFYLHLLWLKALSLLICSFWIFNAIGTLNEKNQDDIGSLNEVNSPLVFLINLSTLILILFVAFNKYINSII